jgi:2,3-bisphosphoglycerate-dependent phosphoglycerate mutase
MKTILRSLIVCCMVIFAFAAHAQSKTTTIIVVRHAEKEIVTGDAQMKADPPLSAEGKTRAENLITALKEFTPSAVFTTNYERTKATVSPLAKKLGLDIQQYDPRNQPAFAEKLKTMEGSTILIAGHSNTVPKLVNLLIGDNSKYADLDDSVYNKIYIVRITDGISTVEIREY